MSDARAAGRFVWYDLMTTDPDAARSFYGELIGWTTEVWEGGPAPYTMWKNGDQALGGVMALPEDARTANVPPHWLAYIATPDLDRTLSDAKEMGAQVLYGPVEIPSAGRFAVVADPHGAVFSPYTPADEALSSDAPARVGEFSWHELVTTDHAAAFDFYHKLFGWEKTEAVDMGEMGVYQMYGRGGPPLGGIYDKPADMPAPPHWLLYIRVADVQAASNKVKALGGQILHGPTEVPGGDQIVQCLDPQGAVFALHQAAVG